MKGLKIILGGTKLFGQLYLILVLYLFQSVGQKALSTLENFHVEDIVFDEKVDDVDYQRVKLAGFPKSALEKRLKGKLSLFNLSLDFDKDDEEQLKLLFADPYALDNIYEYNEALEEELPLWRSLIAEAQAELRGEYTPTIPTHDGPVRTIASTDTSGPQGSDPLGIPATGPSGGGDSGGNSPAPSGGGDSGGSSPAPSGGGDFGGSSPAPSGGGGSPPPPPPSSGGGGGMPLGGGMCGNQVITTSIDGGTYYSIPTLGLSSDTDNTTIVYCLSEGSSCDPKGESGTLYTGAFAVGDKLNATFNVSFYSYVSDCDPSDTQTMDPFVLLDDDFTAPEIYAEPGGGTFPEPPMVEIVSSEPAFIYYCIIDASEDCSPFPDDDGIVYEDIPFQVGDEDGEYLMKVVAVDKSYNQNQSEVLNEIYKVDSSLQTLTLAATRLWLRSQDSVDLNYDGNQFGLNDTYEIYDIRVMSDTSANTCNEIGETLLPEDYGFNIPTPINNEDMSPSNFTNDINNGLEYGHNYITFIAKKTSTTPFNYACIKRTITVKDPAINAQNITTGLHLIPSVGTASSNIGTGGGGNHKLLGGLTAYSHFKENPGVDTTGEGSDRTTSSTVLMGTALGMSYE